MLQGEHHLHDADDAGRCLRVTQVRLGGAKMGGRSTGRPGPNTQASALASMGSPGSCPYRGLR